MSSTITPAYLQSLASAIDAGNIKASSGIAQALRSAAYLLADLENDPLLRGIDIPGYGPVDLVSEARDIDIGAPLPITDYATILRGIAQAISQYSDAATAFPKNTVCS